MHHKLIFFLLILSPLFSFSQTSARADSANKLILNGQACTDRTYTKVEKMPALKVSNQGYADTLGAYLQFHAAFPQNRSAKFKFIVTCHGEINSIECYTTDVQEQKEIEKAILLYSALWVPARQNGYIVNSYVSLTLNFVNDKLDIKISQ